MRRKVTQGRDHDRLTAAIGVATLHGLLGYALIAALGIEIPTRVRDDLKLFEIRPESPPLPTEKPVSHRARSDKPKAAAAKPNLKSKPSEVVVRPPEVRLVVPPPVVAPASGLGGDPFAGAAAVPGPGTGSGGEEAGAGNDGEGKGDDDFTPPRWLRGQIKDSDYPRGAGEVGIGRTITVRFNVEPDGKVSECTVIESSGNPILDDATCRSIERRYRYEPSRDAQGTAVPSAVVEDHIWAIEKR